MLGIFGPRIKTKISWQKNNQNLRSFWHKKGIFSLSLLSVKEFYCLVRITYLVSIRELERKEESQLTAGSVANLLQVDYAFKTISRRLCFEEVESFSPSKFLY